MMSSMPEARVFHCISVDDTFALGIKIGEASPSGSVISLQGPLGSGKTVLAKGIAVALNIDEPIVSPTFTLVQEYCGTRRLHHMDLYRLEGQEEFESIGGEELLYGDGITVIEWSEKIEALLPPHTINISISINDDQSRTITLRGLRL
ncbi:MAG: tRNA (adenosine(37)-N6)-threonylcarbamoyltransferase complex ATPase subunit type 1 TsaE [Sphaerochaetaceae bacterium]|nr:tRNA (adenosine(37)-N6)-threonylcarbamoyltransferase complex ATPase subunit type 1 TsaE [Sphaerochaetaceae bacterium]MDD3669885.1 tRNA (adenosine(37)-N6)-threonylcarbamoyltransferase complex ATPase subunit type 1 TsaE [Sphaerochaetaceae bacterium]MDD4841944.1 tRNA (adenosine(37)-N6)-threonylcarbamoyltransferase complex ATPase subunit type 1 TsaE [Sphaerochaetaceae bacterium]MDX9934460.1 tRNA (adenosine(37)-N6)-threonylcarbamoyltransferase complex ATPase subunit type 1 TsaE [Sphaerochaetaceae 